MLLLAKGHRVFFGPPDQAPAFAAAMGLPCPAGSPIAEHLLLMASHPPHLQLVLQHQRLAVEPAAALLPGSAAAGPCCTPHEEPHGAQLLPAGDDTVVKGGKGSGANSGRLHRRSLGHELGVLFWRAGADMLRTPGLLLLHLALAVLSGLLVGLIFFRLQVRHKRRACARACTHRLHHCDNGAPLSQCMMHAVQGRRMSRSRCTGSCQRMQ